MRYVIALLILPACAAAGISPSKLRVNLGPLPINAYDERTLNSGYYPTSWCPSSETVESCVVGLLQNYAAQGVTGVRFPFGLGRPR
jgi:hypothetical protein